MFHATPTAHQRTSSANMATTRVRKAFRYPSESEGEDEPDEMDEEHQERLISSLQTEDQQKNELYRKCFLAIPLFASFFFLYAFVVASTTRARAVTLLSVSSLGCTAYILYFMPVEAPDRKGKKPVYRVEAEKTPVEKYLVYLNGALAGLLLLAATVSWRRGLGEVAWREMLPAGTFHGIFTRQIFVADFC